MHLHSNVHIWHDYMTIFICSWSRCSLVEFVKGIPAIKLNILFTIAYVLYTLTFNQLLSLLQSKTLSVCPSASVRWCWTNPVNYIWIGFAWLTWIWLLIIGPLINIQSIFNRQSHISKYCTFLCKSETLSDNPDFAVFIHLKYIIYAFENWL